MFGSPPENVVLMLYTYPPHGHELLAKFSNVLCFTDGTCRNDGYRWANADWQSGSVAPSGEFRRTRPSLSTMMVVNTSSARPAAASPHQPSPAQPQPGLLPRPPLSLPSLLPSISASALANVLNGLSFGLSLEDFEKTKGTDGFAL